MKKTTIALLVTGVAFAASSTWAADEAAGKPLTAEQQQQRSALIQQYDANKDGVLDNKEAKKMSRADKKALGKLGGVGTAKKSAAPEKAKGEAKAAKGKAKEATEQGKAAPAGATNAVKATQSTEGAPAKDKGKK
jgi:hypothetical protein